MGGTKWGEKGGEMGGQNGGKRGKWGVKREEQNGGKRGNPQPGGPLGSPGLVLMFILL